MTPAQKIQFLQWKAKRMAGGGAAKSFGHVVDSEGNPLTAYHGTSDKIDKFQLGHPNRKDVGWLGHGIYFTNNSDMAMANAEMKAKRVGGTPKVMSVHLNLQNPYYATLEDKARLQKANSSEASQDFTNALKDKGHDGVIWKQNDYHEYVAFHPDQVKILPQDDVVRKNEGGEVDSPLAMMGRPQRRMASNMAVGPQPLTIDAYHGTPHRLPPTASNPLGEFDPSKIGTGEGAQVYGYGHYFAENPEVAGVYQRKLTVGDHYVDGKILDTFNPRHLLAKSLKDFSGNQNPEQEALESLNELAQYGGSPSIKKTALEAINLFNKGDRPEAKYVKPEGHLYTVHIPDEHIERMLDYDVSFNKQPKRVKETLLKMYPSRIQRTLEYYKTDDLPMSQLLHHLGNDAVLAEQLQKEGIPGIKYFDEGSRNDGKGTRNFVIFPGEEKHLKILKREAKGGAVRMNTGGPVSLDAMRLALLNVPKMADGGRKVSPIGFYSPAAEAAANLPQSMGSPEQMGAMLAKNRGVTDEMQNSGYAQKVTTPKVSKQDLVKHFESEMPDVQETVLNEFGATFKKMSRPEMAAAYERIVGYNPIEDEPNITDDELREILHGMARDSGELDGITEDGKPLPKYGQYTLPGGENYREVLLHLPFATSMAEGWTTRQMPDGKWRTYAPQGYYLDELSGSQAEAESKAPTQNKGAYQSSHWDEPNVLAHIRVNDRTDKNGKKVLFVEELQSDWAQEGRKQGFAGELEKQIPVALQNTRDAARNTGEVFDRLIATGLSEQQANNHPDFIKAYDQERAIKNAYGELNLRSKSNIPTAPFVSGQKKAVVVPVREEQEYTDKFGNTKKRNAEVAYNVMYEDKHSGQYKSRQEAEAAAAELAGRNEIGVNTEGWLNLALKRIAKMAVDGGYDKVAFVNGDQSADRYDLSKKVGSVHYFPEGDGVGKGSLVAMPIGKDIDSSDETAMSHDNVAPEDLEKYVGKDVAKSLLSSPKTNGRHTVAGNGLKVGGEGMKKFYDQIVPAAVNKLLPRIKGKKLETVHLVNQAHDFDPDDLENATPEELAQLEAGGVSFRQPGFEVTPEMREHVKKGLPIFKKGGTMKGYADGGTIKGNTMPTLAQMKMALMKPNDISSIGVSEAPSMSPKAYFSPDKNSPYGQIPVGGVDLSMSQQGQQLMAQPPQQPQNPLQPQNAMQPQNALQPQGGPQPPQGALPEPSPQGPPQGPQGPQSNMLQMTPQGQMMGAMKPQGAASGGSIQYPTINPAVLRNQDDGAGLQTVNWMSGGDVGGMAEGGSMKFAIQPAKEMAKTPENFTPYDDSSPSIKKLTTAFNEAIAHHLSLSQEDRVANSQRAANAVSKYIGRTSNGKAKDLLGKNAKLIKSEKGEEEAIKLPDGRGIETTGLALSPAYQEKQFQTCPNHAACKAECLGKTSGNYFKLGGGQDLTEFKGPRLNSLLKTQAFLRDPHSFAVKLHDEIQAAKDMAAANNNHLGVRLNVLSDIAPAVHESIINAHPDVTFYDYTKNKSNPIAPNHHYTYSSTGATQPGVENPNTNWKQMRKRLDNGDNVAMAFSHKEHLPQEIHDQETGKLYKVIDGDSHDFRPLDIQPEGSDGVIVGLKNKKATGKVSDAHKDSKGFFVHYDPQLKMNPNGTYERSSVPRLTKEGKPKIGETIPQNRRVNIIPQEKVAETFNNDGEKE